MYDILQFPFSSMGQTVLIAAPTSAPPTGVQVPTTGTNKETGLTYRFYNDGANAVFVGWGATAGAAQTASVVPTGGTPQNSVPIPSKSAVCLNFPIGTFFSAIALTATANLYITPGAGLD